MFSVRQALKTGWQKYFERPWYFLGLTLVAALLFFATTAQGAAATALSYVIYGGFLSLLLRHYAGETVSFDNMFDLDNRWISLAFLGIIKGVLIVLGLLLFIVPGVYLAIKWMFAELYVIDKGMRPMEALRASAELTRGCRWRLFGFVVLGTLIMLLGLVVLIVGFFVASVILGFAMIFIYRHLEEHKSEQVSQVVPIESEG